MEGPRAVRPEEFASLRELTDTVFRTGLVDEYRQLFNEDNVENLRVCVDDGRCVSHVGMTERGASLFGCSIGVCCIGAVATHPDYRGQGLASACFDDAVAKAYGDGMDIMIVSGNRNLYRMRGCLRVGNDTAFTLTKDALGEDPSITVEPMADDDLPLVTECYRREPVRFLRPLEDYRYARQTGFVMNRPSDFLVIRQDGAFRGYVIIQRPADGKARLAELAGDRHAVLAALPEVFRQYGLTELGWQVQRHDHLLRSLCQSRGLPATPTPAAGTVKLINFPQLMERLRPRFEELLGRREAMKLRFRQQDEQYVFAFGDETRVADRDTTTRLLFGAPDDAEVRSGAGGLADVLATILPLPTLSYGINYV